MTPDKKKFINGHKIEQFYWSGKDVVYVDNRLVDEKYDNITAINIEKIYRERLTQEIKRA